MRLNQKKLSVGTNSMDLKSMPVQQLILGTSHGRDKNSTDLGFIRFADLGSVSLLSSCKGNQIQNIGFESFFGPPGGVWGTAVFKCPGKSPLLVL